MKNAFKTQGKNLWKPVREEVFPVRTPGTRAGFLGNSQRSSWGGNLWCWKESFSYQSHFGRREAPSVEQMLVSESTKGSKSAPQARGPRSKETGNFPGWRRSVKDLTCRQSPLKMFTLPFSPLPPRVPFLAGNRSKCVTVMNLSCFCYLLSSSLLFIWKSAIKYFLFFYF